MNSTTETNSSNSTNPFVPMTETQMDSIKGGTTTWPDWFVTMVDDVVDNTQDALDYLDDLIQTVPDQFDSDFWNGAEGNLDEGDFLSDPGL